MSTFQDLHYRLQKQRAEPDTYERLLLEFMNGRSFVRAVQECLATEDLTRHIAERSFFHPTGAAKVILTDFASELSQLRLHFWIPNLTNMATIHDHKWDFASVLLTGDLIDETYEECETGIPYHGVLFSDSIHSRIDEITSLGTRALSLVARTQLCSGNSYVRHRDQLHRTQNNSSSTAVTLFFRTAPIKTSTRVFHHKHDKIVTGV